MSVPRRSHRRPPVRIAFDVQRQRLDGPIAAPRVEETPPGAFEPPAPESESPFAREPDPQPDPQPATAAEAVPPAETAPSAKTAAPAFLAGAKEPPAAAKAPQAAAQRVPPAGVPAAALQFLAPEAIGTVAVPYVVRAGDTLFGIASRFGIPIERLGAANREIRDDTIFIGEILTLPLREPLLPPVREAFEPYVIQPGDTLTRIGARFGVSAEAVQAANPRLDPLRLRPGTIVFVPIEEGVDPIEIPTLYVVQQGDTLSAIAAAFGVSLADLRAANPQVPGDDISPGEILVIPPREGPVGALFRQIRYVVQAGDTEESIAARFQVPLNALRELNVLFAAQPGLVIAVPTPVARPEPPRAPAGFPECRDAPFGQRLELGDDDSAFVAFPEGFTFPFFGQVVREGVFVNSNGNLTFGEGDPTFFPTTDAFVEGPPRIAPLWADLLPVAPEVTPGGVFVEFETLPEGRRMVVTWDRVPYFFDVNRFQTFQVSLHEDGTIAFCYFDVSPPGLEGVRALVGVGGGRAQPRGNVFLFDGDQNPRRLGPDEPTPLDGLTGRILVYRFDPAAGNYRLQFSSP